MPVSPCVCCGGDCCEASINGGDSCIFSSASHLSVSVTSTLVGAGNAAFIAFINYLNAYFVANPSFDIGWNTHQGTACSGNYDASGIAGFWAVQIGTLGGYPVWAYNTGLDSGVWSIGFSNSDIPLSGAGPGLGAAPVAITIFDNGDGTCEAGTGSNVATNNGAYTLTGAITFTLTVEDNTGCEGI